MAKFNLHSTTVFEKHRSGWGFCMSSISPLHDDGGVIFDDFLEKSFSWEIEQNLAAKILPYRQPWVGIVHNPPNMPDWYYYQDSPQSLLVNPVLQESLEFCAGIYTLSAYSQRWLSTRISAPVDMLWLATGPPAAFFTYEKYKANPGKKLIQVGTWLRKLLPFMSLEVNDMQKVWLIVDDAVQGNFDAECLAQGIEPGQIGLTDVMRIPWVDHEKYDHLLSENIVFVNLFDASANNVIVECVARNTPVLVNPLPAVLEYLGKEYPFYFSSLEEAQSKLQNDCLIAETQRYLESMDKHRFTGTAFLDQIINSRIYKSLATPKTWVPSDQIFGNTKSRKMNISLDLLMRHVREQIDKAPADEFENREISIHGVKRILQLFQDEVLRENISNWDY